MPPHSVAIAYRRGVFEKVGLFDERFDACEDVEFNHRVARAGLRCWFTPRVGVHYYPRSSLSGLFRQMVRYGRGRVRLLAQASGHLFPGHLLCRPCLCSACCLGPLLGTLSPWLMALYLGNLALYAAAITLTCAGIATKTDDRRMFACSRWFSWHPHRRGRGHVERGRRRSVPPPLRCSPSHCWNRTGTEAGPTASRGLTPDPEDSDHHADHANYLPGPQLHPLAESGLLNALTVDVEDYYHVSGFERCVARTDWDHFESRVEIKHSQGP